jgi:hypothetical protein
MDAIAHKMLCAIGHKKRLSPGGSVPSGEPLAYHGEFQNQIWAFLGVVNNRGGCQGNRVVLENKK